MTIIYRRCRRRNREHHIRNISDLFENRHNMCEFELKATQSDELFGDSSCETIFEIPQTKVKSLYKTE